MGLFKSTTLSTYVKNIRDSPRELIFNRRLLFTAAIYAMAGIPLTWDQGSSSVIPSLPGFQKAFGITSAANPKQVTNFISFVYVTAGIGSGLSFFVNDRIGRLWSLRLYMSIWIIGQLIAALSFGHLGALYTARFVCGFGVGPLTVIGPVSIVEVAPTEIRGLLATWFAVVMLLSLTISTLMVYTVFIHVAASHLQYSIVFFLPTIIITLVMAASFFAFEPPRWLMLVGREEEAVANLVALRGLPVDHPRVANELEEIRADIAKAEAGMKAHGGGFKATVKETFLVPSNLRRFIQCCVSYALAQLSGANSVTSYLVPILKLVGLTGGTDHTLFISSMYSMSKFFYTLIASFFLIDALGRRKSLFLGISIQMISDIYIGTFIKAKSQGSVSDGASSGAVAAIFIHGFGYAIGLMILPYVFGGELWPNSIRSFGASFTQCFHWLFYFGVSRGTPSILSSMHNWGAFIFFAGWCFVSLTYVFFAVPETAGMSMEQLDTVFSGPWWRVNRQAKDMKTDIETIESSEYMSQPNGDSDSSIGQKLKLAESLKAV